MESSYTVPSTWSVISRSGGEYISIREMREMSHGNISLLVQRHHWASCTVTF